MRLCWLIPDDKGGGIVSVAVSCVRQARKAGHDATLLLLLPSSGWLLHVKDLPVASLALESGAKNAPDELIRWLAKHPQDVLFLNGVEEIEPAIPYIPTAVSTVYVVHDTAPRYWKPAIEHWADLSAVVAVSRTVLEKLPTAFAGDVKARVVYNGSLFPPIPSTDCERADDLIFLGGSNSVKGAYDLLGLWPRLVGRGFGGHLHWFGHIDERLRKRIEKLPASERIICYGRTGRDRIFAVASRCKVLLMLSRVEPFGMATVEAMGVGCVPVAWDIATGTQEIVTSGTGFFALLGDTSHLAGCVISALEQYEEIAPQSIIRARDDFSDEVMWNAYANLLDHLSTAHRSERSRVGHPAPEFRPRKRRLQLLPGVLRRIVHGLLSRSPRLNYLVRDMRGL